MVPAADRDTRIAANLEWLISVRWAALGAQALSVAAAYLFVGSPPTYPLVAAAVLVLGAASNTAAGWWVAHRTASPTAMIMTLVAADIGLLTALLAVNGGAMNPLSILYLVYITLAAVMLPRRATWVAAAASVACFGVLLILPGQSDVLATTDMASHMAVMRLHEQNMWWSFVLAAAITGIFGARLAERLDRQAAALAAAREEAARHQRLASLATLAAGAAHELSTPLSTIAVVTEELDRSLRGTTGDTDRMLLDDVELIRHELARCRSTLDRLSTDAGQSPGEALTPVRAGDVVAAALVLLSAEDRLRVRVSGDTEVPLMVPPAALGQALANLLRNAADATASGQPIDLSIKRNARYAAFTIRDRGTGMPAEIAERAGEPFFTTKAPGKGMGLGVFLSRATVEQLGGHLRLHSRTGEGTIATIELPAAL